MDTGKCNLGLTGKLHLEFDSNKRNDGTRRFSILCETELGLLVLKGFRVDKHRTEILMPILPQGTYATPYPLASASPKVRDYLLAAIEEYDLQQTGVRA
jgi:hypothetical protein